MKKNIYCLFSNRNFKPFLVDIADESAEKVLSDLFSKTFSGAKDFPCSVIKQSWEEGHEVYIHVLQEVVEEEAVELLKYWQEQLENREEFSPLGTNFSAGLAKRYGKKEV